MHMFLEIVACFAVRVVDVPRCLPSMCDRQAPRRFLPLPLEVFGHEELSALLDKPVVVVGGDGGGHRVGVGAGEGCGEAGDAVGYGAHAQGGAGVRVAQVEHLDVGEGTCRVEAGDGVAVGVESLGLRADERGAEGAVGVGRDLDGLEGCL